MDAAARKTRNAWGLLVLAFLWPIAVFAVAFLARGPSEDSIDAGWDGIFAILATLVLGLPPAVIAGIGAIVLFAKASRERRSAAGHAGREAVLGWGPRP